MSQKPEQARKLAQNLVEILSPYEEELILLEREAPAYGPLRRAVGMAIAEACYRISDEPPRADLTPPTDDESRRTR